MKNTTSVRENLIAPKKSRKSVRGNRAMRLESLEIRDLLAANTLDFVDNLEIGAPGQTRDLQLEVDDSSGESVVALRIKGSSGNFNPNVPLIFIQDTNRNNPANHIPMLQSMADAGGTTDSFVVFKVKGGDNFTIQVGGSGAGGFVAEIMQFGSTNADGLVSQVEYQSAVAAELQARGVGNHNTAAYFQATWGINFTQSQFNTAFDANLNGKVDSFELDYIHQGMGQPKCKLDLIGDSDAPVATAKVAVDTGVAGDNITSDIDGTGNNSAIVGTITDFSKIVSATLSIDGKSTSIDLLDNPSINALNITDTKITFGLDVDDLAGLLGSSVVNTGGHTLSIVTEDELGNVSVTPFELDFEFDTNAPSAPTGLDLAEASDSGQSKTDNITSDTTPTISVTAEAGSTVTFTSSLAGKLGTAVANASGVATFTPTTGIAEGTHLITATSTDKAGNVSAASSSLSITIDTINPSSFSGLTLTNATTNPNLTNQATGTFSGKSEANALVELLDENSAVVATTTADGSGNFTFDAGDAIALDLGNNNFTFRATDAAGNQASAVFVVDRNTAPTITAGQIYSVVENASNGASVGSVAASGNDAGDTLTYAITGIDAGFEGAFAINSATGAITVADASKLNFENKSSFTLTIQVTDSFGNGAGGQGLTTTQTVTVNLNDFNEAPTFDQATYTFGVQENSAAGTSVGTVTGSDVDADDTSLTYGISGGTGSSLFVIDSATGAITVANGAALDFESKTSYTLDVTLTDNLGASEAGTVNTVTKTITINLIDVNEEPDFVGEPITLSVAEDAGENGVVGTISATDVDADDSMSGDLTFGLASGGTGDGLFQINPTTGQITLTAAGAAALDFETTTSYTLNVTVTDNLNGNGTGEVGAVNTITTQITIDILDANEAPEFVGEPISFSLPEDAQPSDAVGSVAATDEDADDTSLTYGISGGTGASLFQIDPATGQITVAPGASFDFETTTSYTLNVTATDVLDGDGAGEVGSVKTTTTVVTINITNVNELPSVPGNVLDLGQLRLTAVDEASEIGNTVKVTGLVDPEGQTLTYTDNSGNPFFEIDANGNVILLDTVDVADMTDGELLVTLNNVEVTDGIDTKTITVTFRVVENAPPEFTSPTPGTTVTIDENLPDDVDLANGDPIDDTLVLTATDEEMDPVTFSVAPSTAHPDAALAALFTVADVNGNMTVVVADAANLNYNYVNAHGATNGTFTINLVVTDSFGGFTTQTLEITVTDRNDTPTFTDPGTLSLDEYVAKGPDASFGTEVGTEVFDASTAFDDADLGDSLTYTLDAAVVTGTSVDVSAAFAIDPTTGVITVVDPTLLNAEGITPDQITLTITATDNSGAGNDSVSGDIAIDIIPQNELPIYVTPSPSFDIRYNLIDGQDGDDITALGNVSKVLTATDPEGDTITYSQRTTGANGEAFFKLNSDGSVTSIAPVDFTADEMVFTLVYDYADGDLNSNTDLGFTDGFVLTIRVFKNPPAEFDQADYDFSIDENTAAGSNVVQTVTATDPEGETVTYSINDPSGTFAINPTTGAITVANAAALNHEANATLTFDVIATDEADNDTIKTITVTINDLNEAPSITNATLEFGISEDAANGAAVGTVTTSDPDAGDSISSYQIVGGTGQGIFSIDANGNITVSNASQLDFETAESYTLQVRVTDNGGPTPGSNLLTDTETFTINIGDINEAPVLTGADFDLPIVDESNLTSAEIGTVGDDFFTKVYSNATYNFLGQFTDPEGDALNLTIANKAAIEALDYVQSIDYNNTTDELTIVFVHYGVNQNRAPFSIEFVAQEAAGDMLSAATSLDVGVEVTNQQAVDFKLIPVASPTASTQAFAGISEAQLPTAIDRVADEQTFTIEIWGSTLVGQDDVTAGNAWIEGFRNVTLALTYNTALVSTTAGNIVAPLKLGGTSSEPITVNPATGEIVNFNAFFDFEDLPAGIGSAGGKGEYVRLGYVTLTVNSGVDTNNLSVNDLLTIDLDDPDNAVLLNGADAQDLNPNAAADPIPRTDEIQVDVVNSQVNIELPAIEIVDAMTFTVSQADSKGTILTGANGSTINGNQIAAQATGGNIANMTGKIFVLFDGPAANPTTIEIVGTELIFTTQGKYTPGAPASQGGEPQTEGTSGNFGLTSSDANSTTSVALRQTVLRTAGSSQVINLAGNASSGGATFNSQGVGLMIGSGFADVNVNFPGITSVSARKSIGGEVLGNNGAESSMLVGDGAGGFTLTLDLNRVLLNEVLALNSQTSRNFNLLLDATIVAEVNGGANLSGTVFKKDNQPLEDGSGVFVTVNKYRTETDTNGQVAELPQSTQWASEWDGLWVEVWGNTADAFGIYGGSLDLSYNTDLFTATQIEYASGMNVSRTGTIDDAAGKVIGLGSQSLASGLGNGQFVLLGRVKLEALPGEGIEVSLDDYKAESLGLAAENVQLGLTGVGMTDVASEVADVDVWGMAYDVNDDGKIGMTDFNQFVQAFGRSTLESNEALVAVLDFDNNGKVGLSDFNFFVQNFGKDKSDALSIVYPETFTQSWVGRKIELTGEDSLEDVFNQALTDWQEALGWDQPIEVKLVVTDYGDAQLGEAQLLTLDENGLPSMGILTLDDDGAGLGWSSDLAGGPAEGQYDLYTVILHELGHLYGFMSFYSGFADNVIFNHHGEKIFMGPDFVVTLDDLGHHVDDVENPGDVMNDTLEPGQRKTISALDVKMLQAAYASAAGATVTVSQGAALHAATSEMIVSDAPAVIVSEQPITFAFQSVTDVETVSGRTGYDAMIAPVVYDQLVRNGVRVTTTSLPQVQQQMDEIDSAFVSYAGDETALLVADSVENVESFRTEEDSTSIDDLFADWDSESDLEG